MGVVEIKEQLNERRDGIVLTQCLDSEWELYYCHVLKLYHTDLQVCQETTHTPNYHTLAPQLLAMGNFRRRKL